MKRRPVGNQQPQQGFADVPDKDKSYCDSCAELRPCTPVIQWWHEAPRLREAFKEGQ